MIRPPKRSRLHRAVEVRDSLIHGRGLFAASDLSAGTVVIELGGRVLTDFELEGLLPPHSSVGLDAGRHLLIEADDPAHFRNHSCDPNLWLDGPLREIARRDIVAGEELTVDYATQTTRRSWRMLCSCGAAACRVLITSEDWREEDLQERYRDHWNPLLEQRRDRANEW